MILAANRCRDRSPNIYIADSVSEIEGILNPRPGDVVWVIVSGSIQAWRLIEDSTETADGFAVIQSNACNSVWVLADDLDVTFDLFGAVGDGETDDTDAWNEAAASVPAGSVLRGTPGKTYLLDGVVIEKPITLDLTGITMLQKPLATAPMIKLTPAGPAFLNGGIFDGNKANQAASPIWRALLQAEGAAELTVRDSIFQNGTFAGIRMQDFTGSGFVQNCRFQNFAEHGGVLNDKLSTHIYLICVNAALSGARPLLTVKDCKFIQDNAPSVHGANPGGIIVQGSDALNIHPSVVIKDNYFKNVGQDINGNHIGCIDLYEDVLHSEISGNRCYNSRYLALKLQNCGQVTVKENILWGDDTDTYSVILYDPQQRTQAGGTYDDVIIEGNILKDDTLNLGILVQGINDKTRKFSICNNHVTGAEIGISISGAAGTEGPVLVSGNTIRSSGVGGSGILVENFSGKMRLAGNDVLGSGHHGLQAISGVNGASFFLSNNIFSSDTNGFFGAVVRGAAAFHSDSGEYSNTGGGSAINLQQDSLGNQIGELSFNQETNIISAGGTSIVAADILRWRGISQGTGTPEGSIVSRPGNIRIRTDIASILFKRSGNGNTGYRSVFHGNGGVVTTGNYAMNFSDTMLGVSAFAAARIITLPPMDALSNGRPYFVAKSDASVNTVTVQPDGSDVLNGGNVILSTQFEIRIFINDGTSWYVI